MAVIGLTCRMDAISLFEKRVRSRFSHRQIYLLAKPNLGNFIETVKNALLIQAKSGLKPMYVRSWNKSIEDLLGEDSVQVALKKIFQLNSRYNLVYNILVLKRSLFFNEKSQLIYCSSPRQFVAISRLSETHQFLSAKDITAACTSQTTDCKTLQLQGLSILELQLVTRHFFEKFSTISSIFVDPSWWKSLSVARHEIRRQDLLRPTVQFRNGFYGIFQTNEIEPHAEIWPSHLTQSYGTFRSQFNLSIKLIWYIFLSFIELI